MDRDRVQNPLGLAPRTPGTRSAARRPSSESRRRRARWRTLHSKIGMAPWGLSQGRHIRFRHGRGNRPPGLDGEDRRALQAARLHLPVDRRSTAASSAGTTARSASSSSATSRTPGGGRWSASATTSSGSTPRSSCTRGSGRPPATWRASPTRWSTARSASSASAPTSSSDAAVRRASRPSSPGEDAKCELTEPRQFNLMFKTFVGPVVERAAGRLPAPRDRAGHLRQLRERAPARASQAAVRHRADRQVLPQRDHARQLHLPHARVRADGDGVLRQARHDDAKWFEYWMDERVRWYPRSASGPRTCACASTRRTSSRTTPRAAPTSSTCSRRLVGARGHRQPHRLRPAPARRVLAARTSPTSTRRPGSASSPT